ncbi:MAG: hypothetical protein IKF77_07630, partial [Thermoguttaceae bacterium]|nr:hypothetical protein [Thermoguttaceae bacterium]
MRKLHFPSGLSLLCLLAAALCGAAGFVPPLAAEQPTHSAVTPQNRDIPRYHQQLERLERGDVDVLMVGDSITHLWESVGRDVWERFYGSRKVMNFGVDGDRTGQTLWRIEHSPMDKISPKLVVMMIGTNNVGSSIIIDGQKK